MLFRLLKNAVSLIILGLVDKCAYILFFAFIARALTQNAFGAYGLVLTLMLIGGLLASFGIENVLVREIAKNRERSESLFNSALLIALLFSLPAWACVSGISIFLNYEKEIVLLVTAAGPVFLCMAFSQTAGAVMKAHERMGTFALAGCFHSILGSGLGVCAVWLGGGVRALVVVFVVNEALKALFMTFLVHRFFTPLARRYDTDVMIKILKQAVPFALLTAYGIFLRRIDIVMMGWLQPLDDTAIYAASAKFADFLSLFSGSLVAALFPAFSAQMGTGGGESLRLYTDSIGYFALLGFGAAFGAMVLAEPIAALLFGSQYVIGSTCIRWMGWAFLFSVLSGPAGIALVASGEYMHRLLIMCLVVLCINVVVNLFLIPRFSYNGAAAATFICAVLGCAGRLVLIKMYFRRLPDLPKTVWRYVLGGGGMAGVLFCMRQANILVLIGIGIFTYSFLLGMLGEFDAPRYKPFRMKITCFARKLLGRECGF